MRRFYIFLVLLPMIAFTIASCDSVVKKTAGKMGKSALKQSVKNVSKETAEAASKKVAKEVAAEATEGAAKNAARKTLREFASSDGSIRALYESLTKRISKEFADGVVVTTTQNGVEMMSKDFPNSFIIMTKNMIIGKGGSLKNSGPMNEFLNHLLPDKTYMVDDAFIFKTDEFGRVVSGFADRTKAFKTIERNPQRNSHIQKYVVESLDGKVGLDDAGHLFANTTGGPNELINQVPMSRKLNQHGQWRELERMEEKALKEGKNVLSQRNLLYKGNEKRPYAIEFITKIDGVETKVLVENI